VLILVVVYNLNSLLVMVDLLQTYKHAAAPSLASGSATASVQSGDTFVVTTSEQLVLAKITGSRFTGSINVSGS
jgi:hypothetical protein